jgi:DNA-3-methyladenine glycosylase
MFGPPGVAYVYLVYGMYDCLNVVTEPAGSPAAVLVRAVEPLEGVPAMRTARIRWLSRRRGLDGARLAAERDRLGAVPVHRLASGPGLVAAAFSIARSDTGLDLCAPASPLRLESAPLREEPARIVAGARVGIRYAGEPWTSHPWRLAIGGNAAVSRPSLGD